MLIDGNLIKDTTIVYERNKEAFYNDDIDVVVNQGGTRSSKTYSILQMIDTLCREENPYTHKPCFENAHLTVGRAFYSDLADTAMKDFFRMQIEQGTYNAAMHNKTDHIYKIGTNEIEFIGMDQGLKGRQHDLVYINEANEVSFEQWNQIRMRLKGKAILDYNPSDEFHWIYDKVIPNPRTAFIQSTYEDNTFLSAMQIANIEARKDDPVRWAIYGKGITAHKPERIHSNWEATGTWPTDGESIYGIDFGINNPTAVIEIKFADKGVHVRELMYESGILNDELIRRLKEDFKISTNDYMYCDTEDKNRIGEIQQAGFNAYPSDKDVKSGIDYVNRYKLYVYQSPYTERELKTYSWKKDSNDRVLDDVVKSNDHACNAIRYAMYSYRHLRETMSIDLINNWN